ncbi:MAG: hypothetical protein GY772_23270, partial [bacterium]|nr:hypothetical protein [bacterium]
VRCIRDSWFAFDGTVPHCVLPFQGNRLSIVYFTRAKYPTTKDDVTMTLLQHGFNASGEKYEKFAGKHTPPPPFEDAAAAAAADGSKRRRLEAAPEDEIDEEEQMDAALVMESEGPQWRGKDWARQFCERLGVPCAGHASVGRSVGFTTGCTGRGPRSSSSSIRQSS